MLERLQRVIAAISGVPVVSAWVYGTLNATDPGGRSITIILFRLVWCALIFFALLRRAAGRRLDRIAWAALAMLVIPGIWEAKTQVGSIVSALSGGLMLVGGGIELALERAAQHRVAADGAAPGR